MHPNCDAVNDILQAAGLPGRVRMLDEAVATARAAAQYLGCPVGAIANSLIFATSSGEPLLIITSGAHRVDMAKVGDELEVQLRRASPEFVREHRPADRRGCSGRPSETHFDCSARFARSARIALGLPPTSSSLAEERAPLLAPP